MVEVNKEIEEAIVAERKSLEYDAKDEDLITAINAAIQESKKLKEAADKVGERNELYWEKGTDLDTSDIHPKRAKISDNRIFMAIETLLSIAAGKTPEPMVAGDISNEIREKLIKALTIAYEVKLKIKQKLQAVIRHWFIFRIGVWKYRWDEGFILETVKPTKIGVDPRATSIQDCEFIYELLEDTIGNLKEKFPDKKEEITQRYGDDRDKTKVKYYEFWGGNGEWVAWKLGAIMLDKMKNPNFDYGATKEGEQEGTNNLFKEPQLPYLLINVFSLGDNLYDNTSLIEQAIPLQDGLNKRKNQISDLTDEQKKVIIASSQAISKEEAQKFVNKYGHVLLWLDKGDISQVNVIEGKADPASFNDMNHSTAEIDNVMGTHTSLRGERKEQETLGGRKLLISADYGRIDVIVENVEQLMEDFYNAYVHMLKVYGLEDEEFSDGEETIKLTREEIPEGTLVMVKKGSTLPVDKASRAEMAVKLAQFGFIDPETLFDELGYANAPERAQQLFEWKAMIGEIQQQPEGGGENRTGDLKGKLEKLRKSTQSPAFKKLPMEQQQEIMNRIRQATGRVKGGR